MDVAVWGIAVLTGLGAIAGAFIVARAARTAFTIGGIALIGLGVSVITACAGRPWVACTFAAVSLIVLGAFAFMAHLLLGRGHTADASGDDPAAEASSPRPRFSGTVMIAIFAAWLALASTAVFADRAIDASAARGPAPDGGWLLTALAVIGLAATQFMAVVFLLDRPTADERARPDERPHPDEGGAEGSAA